MQVRSWDTRGRSISILITRRAYAVYAEILERRVVSTPEVARLWRKSYELDPNSQIAQEWLASSLAASGQLDEALKVREAIAAKNPGSAQALFLLGRFYLYVLGRYDDAIVAFRKHVALDPEHKGIPDVIANAYWNLGRSGTGRLVVGKKFKSGERSRKAGAPEGHVARIYWRRCLERRTSS